MLDGFVTTIDQAMGLNFTAVLPSLPFLLAGIGTTLLYTFIPLTIGLFLGMILSGMRLTRHPLLRGVVTVYVSIFRGTPILVQLALIYFATPQLTGYEIPAFQAGILSLSLNSAAYISEIFRGGIRAVHKGQWEAAATLGLTRTQTLKKVIFPQVIPQVIPALVNESVDLLKESALVSTIGAWDLMRRANMIAAEKYVFFEPLLIVALIYYILVMILTATVHTLEQWRAKKKGVRL